MLKKEYIATFKDSYQISPEDFAVFNPTLKVEDTTTVGEIKEWYRKVSHGKRMEITLIEVETLKETY